MKLDYYKVLGLERTATAAEIKKAYRELALHYHPDRNPHDAFSEERFKLLTEAYEVLKHARKKAAYDRLIAASEAHGLQDAHTAEDSFCIPAEELLGDFLRGFFETSGGTMRKAAKGKDLRHNLKISFEEAALGAEAVIKMPCRSPCPQCGGLGVLAGSKVVRCPACRGRGTARSGKGADARCSSCDGAGTLHTAPCRRCAGSGEVQARRSLTIAIPAGTTTGTRLRVSGMGLPGSDGGAPGDLFIVVQVREHPFFEQQGADIMCTVPVPLFRAVLGGTIEVPTLNGKKKVKLPARIQNGRKIRLRGMGIRGQGPNRRGDLIIAIAVEVPTKLRRTEKKLIRELMQQARDEHYPLTQRFLKNMKSHGSN